jgi:hypothetical protein
LTISAKTTTKATSDCNESAKEREVGGGRRKDISDPKDGTCAGQKIFAPFFS